MNIFKYPHTYIYSSGGMVKPTYKNGETAVNIEKFIEELHQNGWVDAGGFYLATREALIDDQKDWDEEDPAKNVDLTVADFWITTNNGFGPEPIRGVEELKEYLKENGYLIRA